MFVELISITTVLSVIIIVFISLKGSSDNNAEHQQTNYEKPINERFNVNSPFWACPIYQIQTTEYPAQFGEDKFIINYFEKKNLSPFNRVYIEVGAFDGYEMSNTYALEHGYGWKGLLIEGGPMLFDRLLHKDRPRSVKINKALCNNEGFVEFNDGAQGLGGLEKYENKNNEATRIKWGQKKVKVQCAPVTTLIKENGLRYIDIFSLDVEGAEEEVLNSFDWNIPVRIWIIEVNALVQGGTEEEKQRCRIVQNILKDHGYVFIGKASTISVNEFYENPKFDELIKGYIREDDEVYTFKHCPLPPPNQRLRRN